MTTTITQGATTITPDLVLGYEAQSETTTVVHLIIGRPEDPDVTSGPDGLRTGTLEMFFKTHADAWEAYGFHKAGGVFVLADTVVTELDMSFVRAGQMRVRLDPETQLRWILSVGYHEVAA